MFTATTSFVLENINNSTFVPCILANKNFASTFLFSQETTEECPEAIILQCLQSIVGVLIQVGSRCFNTF